MAADNVFDLTRLRRACASCTLQQLCLPAGLDAASAARLDELVRRRQNLERGAALFRAGDPLESLYVVRAGALKTTGLSADGQEQVLGFHLPGELAGLDALAEAEHRCEAVALGPTVVCEVPFAELTAVATQLPALQQQLLRVIGRSSRDDHDHVEMLIRRQASDRIAMFLHGLRERVRQSGSPDNSLQLPMTREDIGRFLGLAFETVSRAFAKLQEEGVIAVSGRRVEIRDARALERMAHGEASSAADATRNTAGEFGGGRGSS
jgi:CRP/FNR family transcriptional regulator